MRKPRLAANWLRRRRLRTALSLLAISLALSCGLSPVEDLPSASDGEDGLDLVSGVGGSIAVGSGGLPGCLPGPTRTECRAAEVWQLQTEGTCSPVELLVEVCDTACQADQSGVATCVAGDGGAGGAAGSANVDNGQP